MKQRYPASLSNPDNSAEKQEAYCTRIAGLDDAALLTETEHRIWLSAYAYNNPRSCYHWQADACHDEAVRRSKPEIYTAAFDKAKASAS